MVLGFRFQVSDSEDARHFLPGSLNIRRSESSERIWNTHYPEFYDSIEIGTLTNWLDISYRNLTPDT